MRKARAERQLRYGLETIIHQYYITKKGKCQ
nr:MAG TPA: hypothetical protein [Caudoviricetes sp.]